MFNRVQVVDDESLIRFATVEALEDAGFEVHEAGTADEVLVLLQKSDVDAVFTDLNMPGRTARAPWRRFAHVLHRHVSS